MNESDKIMFEIFRDVDAPRHYHVVYFTELDEHERDRRITQALAGEHVFDGFISTGNAERSKDSITSLVDRLNSGESLNQAQLESMLAPYVVS